MNAGTIATNLAGRFSATNLTAPSGYAAVTYSTHLLPNAITTTPCVLVFPPALDDEFGTGARRGEMQFTVRFYLAASAEFRENLTALYAWWDPLVDALVADYDIGAPSEVIDATITHMEMRPLQYEEQTFPGIEITVRVRMDGSYPATT